MYPDIDYTWNPIKGKCSHDCSYCYMKDLQKRYKHDLTLRLDEKCFKDNFYKFDKFIRIFVGSSTDIFADNIPKEWIDKVLDYCCNFDDNDYLFQTKNPARMFVYDENCLFPSKTILGVTIESNRNYNISKAPIIDFRKESFRELIHYCQMISIEPILDFDLSQFVNLIFDIKPLYISIGADSKRSNLPEPNEDKIVQLVQWLRKLHFEVKLKPNLKRLAPSLFNGLD